MNGLWGAFQCLIIGCIGMVEETLFVLVLAGFLRVPLSSRMAKTQLAAPEWHDDR